jgi:hypothetical protein
MFFASIEIAAQIGQWEQADKLRIAVLKLTGASKKFYNGSSELHEEEVTWQEFKNEFRQSFRYILTDQYHFTKLQTARKGRNKSPEDFADRCGALAQRITVAQRIGRENADYMVLASFVVGLTGVTGRQLSYSNQQGMEQALSIALSVQEAQRQEKFKESFYTSIENSVRLVLRSSERTYREDSRSWRPADTHAVNLTRGQHYKFPHSTGKPMTSGTRRLQTKATLKCYECEGMLHFA